MEPPMPATQLVFPEIECSPVVSRPVLALVAQSSDEGCTGNEKRKGRAARHSDSAARKAAYRAAKARVDNPDKPEIIAKLDRKSTRLNSSHSQISYAVFCLKKKKI